MTDKTGEAAKKVAESSTAAETSIVTIDELTKSAEGRSEVSAGTIARMMGLTTVAELKLVEGKIDLLGSKLSGVQIKLEKMLTLLSAMPTGADLERVDVQIGALRQLVREVLGGELEKSQNPAAVAKKPGTQIQSNS